MCCVLTVKMCSSGEHSVVGGSGVGRKEITFQTVAGSSAMTNGDNRNF